MSDTAQVVCPYCFETLELWVDPEQRGSFVQDCDVCCRPWQVYVDRDADTGQVHVHLARAQ
ncbi:MAG: CPXCG motif-containing cysteine-rich protein [Sandaracinaceae bacterium]|nr:MAG: CPXCG motif-containing cysteine-rich protein [Sandaracinaceae bacterium]HBQ18255.1 CPXCG motif-containing cysteine-rich protein [Myxococcales bacterium]